MNLKLILALSVLGLAVALGDVFFIPVILEPILWLAVYLYFAYAIARSRRTWRFANGFVLGLLVSFWITVTHILFLHRYLDKHPREVEMIAMVRSMHLPGSDIQIMSITGPVSGVFTGVIIGVFAVVAGMMMKPRLLPLSAAPPPLSSD